MRGIYVMQRVDRWLIEWAEDEIRQSNMSNLSGINVVEKLLRDPGMATGKSKDRILFFHRNPRIAAISRAINRAEIDNLTKIILIVDYGYIAKEDGKRFKINDLVRNSSLTMSECRAKKRDARRKINSLLP